MNDPGSLGQIDHIVVLMLENRSFDSMLGYLALDDSYDFRDEVDGLIATMKNTYKRRAYRVHPLPGTTMQSWETPSDDGPDVDKQLAVMPRHVVRSGTACPWMGEGLPVWSGAV